MTDTWAAKVLDGVPRHSLDFCDRMEIDKDGVWLHGDAVLAAIARMGAGDDMVERLLENDREIFLPLLGEAAAHIAALNAKIETMIEADAVQAMLDAAQPIMAEACRGYEEQIAALTAQNREMALDVLASSGQAADAYAAQLAAEAERDALRAQMAENRISEPHDPGDFVGDIFYGHPVKTTMGTHRWTGTEWVALPSEAEALAGLLAGARKEAAALRERVERMEGALKGLVEHCEVTRDTAGFWKSRQTHQVSPTQWQSWCKQIKTALAALNDGGKDG